MLENIEILDELIIGRVEPHIYAFSTNTVPDYLKVGDTYRPVSVRLNEWRKHFPTLQEEYTYKAMVNSDIFFRDYAVHKFLVEELHKERLTLNNLPAGVYYSNEFFKGATSKDVSEAIDDIKKFHGSDEQKYQYYNSVEGLPETYSYSSTGTWELRPNQEETVKNFKTAIENGRTNLLLFAVMRFGKSFTSISCAKVMDAKIVLVISAKADVREEWKKTVQSADNFNSDYYFLIADDLKNNKDIIKNTLAGGKGVVVFLTLQDLQGEKIKDKHQEIFANTIDLLIVDETHYGARAEKFGQVLREDKYIKEKYSDDDFIELEDAEEQIKSFDASIKLHLSGTPYRILMGSEFEKEDIIGFYQFTDIMKAQEEWDNDHILCDETKEWQNPYYGFPQMVRFAFNPSKAALQRLQELKTSGTTYTFSALFKPQSVKKTNDGKHKKFVFEQEVLDLFEVIDGSKEDDELLSFLDYDKIKEGKMCRHIVCVLPYCASCDALETLLINNASNFKNLHNYTIINISGIDKPNAYKTVQAVKAKIKECENEGKKTITLTVNRMLTGSTVEQWDTMLFFKDTASPQEYDQAIFRLQNQYVKDYVDESGDRIKYNMKPQTLLVDFDPHRMFSMQEKKSLIYNANTDEGGNQKLKERMEEELRISPIITLNKNKIEQVQATDILGTISAYSKDRGVIDETRDIPIDLSLLDIDAIKREIEKQGELGSKQGLGLNAHEGDETELDLPEDEPDNTNNNDEDNSGTDNDNTNNETDTSETANEIEKLINKFRMYYCRILFFSFLSENTLKSLDDILNCIEESNNTRIARNLALEKNILEAIRDHINLFILNRLDYGIQRINTLAHDETVEPVERAITAIKKFGKLSESEVTTPANTCDDMVALLPESAFESLKGENKGMLDIASKAGEYTVAICKKAEKLGINLSEIKDSVFAIPTSPVAYEFTRKIYEMLGLSTNCIAREFTSYDLLEIKKMNNRGKETDQIDNERVAHLLRQAIPFSSIKLDDEIIEKEGEVMKFEAVVGNPPYQESDGGNGRSAGALYPLFVDLAKSISPNYISIIVPSRWFSGGKGLNEFRNAMLNDRRIKELYDYENFREVFPDVDLAGGACYFLWDSSYNGDCKITNVSSSSGITRALNEYPYFIRQNLSLEIVRKVQRETAELQRLTERISARNPFGLPTNYTPKEDGIPCYFKQRTGRKFALTEDIQTDNIYLNKWKLLVPKSPIAGQTDFTKPVGFYYDGNTKIAAPGECCTDTYIILGTFDSQEELISFKSYIFTKVVRFLLLQTVVSQDVTRKNYCFVPDLGNYEGTYTDQMLCDLWGITDEEWSYIDSRIHNYNR